MAQESMADGQRFEIGKVLSISIAVLGRNLGPFLAITLLVGIPYILVFTLGALQSPSGAINPETGAAEFSQFSSGAGILMAIGGLVALLTYVVVQSAINFGTLQDLRGRRPTIGECLSRGFAVMPRVLGAGLLAGLAVAAVVLTVSMIGLIAPIAYIGVVLMIAGLVFGVLLFVNWWVIIPVLVVEQVGVTACFGRSRTLTAGNRWRIFGLLILVFIAQIVANFLVGMLGALGGVVVTIILSIAVALILIVFNSVLTAVGYYYLRSQKEGIVIDDIVKVFD